MAILVARRILETLRREFRHDPKALLDAAEAAHNEELLEQTREELRHLEQSDRIDEDTKDTLQDELTKEVNNLKARSAP